MRGGPYLLRLDHDAVVNGDLTELVLDDGDALLVVLVGEDPVEQRGLATAEEARDDGHGELLVRRQFLHGHHGSLVRHRSEAFQRVRRLN